MFGIKALKFPFFLASMLVCFQASANQEINPREVTVKMERKVAGTDVLKAFVFETAGGGAKPGIVLMHGCNGAYGKTGDLSPRHLMWGRLLAQAGYVALLIDSFTTRGEDELCSQKFSERKIKESDRIADARAGLRWLASRSTVSPRQLFLLGWSHGASVTLRAIGEKHNLASEGLKAAIAFYPGCSSLAKAKTAFETEVPLLLLIGSSDDWTPAEPCVHLVESLKRRGHDAQIVLYPGAFHTFDQPGDGPVKFRSDIANGLGPGGGAHSGPDPSAREDAKKRVLDYLDVRSGIRR